MSRTSRKHHINVALKVAVVQSGRRQLAIARLAKINEVRFSKIICARVEATEDEMQRLAKVLDAPVDQLFPDAVSA